MTDPRHQHHASPTELRRAAREAEQQGLFPRAMRLRHKADVLDAQQNRAEAENGSQRVVPAGDPLDLSSLTTAELIATLDQAFTLGMAATSELARRTTRRP